MLAGLVVTLLGLRGMNIFDRGGAGAAVSMVVFVVLSFGVPAAFFVAIALDMVRSGRGLLWLAGLVVAFPLVALAHLATRSDAGSRAVPIAALGLAFALPLGAALLAGV